MMRQVAGALEYEKTRLVEKLGAARKRKQEDAHRRHTKEAIAERQFMSALLRQSRGLLRCIEVGHG
jgi:hypothetical protein